MRTSRRGGLLVLGALALAPGCKREDGLGSVALAGGGDARFESAWKSLEQGREVFYVEDESGADLMGRVRRAPRPPAPEPPAPGLAPAAEPATAEEAELPPGDQVASVVRSNLANVRGCYLRLTREGRTVSGRAIVSFTVNKDGGVENVSIDAPAFRDTNLPQCVTQQVSRWSFPKSRKGGLAVSYPFVFVGG